MLIYWEQVAERNGGRFVGLTQTQDFWFTKRNEVWNLRWLYSHFQGNKPLDNKKERAREAPEWAAEPQGTVPILLGPEQDFVLEMCKIPCELYNLGYVLLVDLSMFLFFHGADILPLISEWKKLSEQMRAHKVSSPKKPSFSPVCGGVWTILAWQNGLDNNRWCDKTVSVHSIFECNIWNCLTVFSPKLITLRGN